MTIVVIKSERRLLLKEGEDVLWECPVALGFAPVGKKRAEGDGRTPEGRYRVVSKNPESRFHLALGVSYPGTSDAREAYARGEISAQTLREIERAQARGVRPPWDTPLGGWIMLHGEHPDKQSGDWTAGCVAMRNADIERLYGLCDIGARIEIVP